MIYIIGDGPMLEQLYLKQRRNKSAIWTLWNLINRRLTMKNYISTVKTRAAKTLMRNEYTRSEMIINWKNKYQYNQHLFLQENMEISPVLNQLFYTIAKRNVPARKLYMLQSFINRFLHISHKSPWRSTGQDVYENKTATSLERSPQRSRMRGQPSKTSRWMDDADVADANRLHLE